MSLTACVCLSGFCKCFSLPVDIRRLKRINILKSLWWRVLRIDITVTWSSLQGQVATLSPNLSVAVVKRGPRMAKQNLNPLFYHRLSGDYFVEKAVKHIFEMCYLKKIFKTISWIKNINTSKFFERALPKILFIWKYLATLDIHRLIGEQLAWKKKKKKV
jgi:hypothetical protein